MPNPGDDDPVTGRLAGAQWVRALTQGKGSHGKEVYARCIRMGVVVDLVGIPGNPQAHLLSLVDVKGSIFLITLRDASM